MKMHDLNWMVVKQAKKTREITWANIQMRENRRHKMQMHTKQKWLASRFFQPIRFFRLRELVLTAYLVSCVSFHERRTCVTTLDVEK